MIFNTVYIMIDKFQEIRRASITTIRTLKFPLFLFIIQKTFRRNVADYFIYYVFPRYIFPPIQLHQNVNFFPFPFPNAILLPLIS